MIEHETFTESENKNELMMAFNLSMYLKVLTKKKNFSTGKYKYLYENSFLWCQALKIFCFLDPYQQSNMLITHSVTL